MVDKKTLGVIVGVVLLIVGVGLLLVTEPAGESGSGASGGVADVSEETRPYLIPGVLLLVLGLIVAAAFWLKGDEIVGS